MHLATDTPIARALGDRIVATIPSGSGTVEIALDFHQSLGLAAGLRLAAEQALLETNRAATAQVVAFNRPRGKRRKV